MYKKIRVLVVGCGNMGGSHARAYRTMKEFEIVGVVSRGPESRGGGFAQRDRVVDMSNEPEHQELCRREQRFFLKAIREDLDLTDHFDDTVNSLAIVLASDRSVRSGRAVWLTCARRRPSCATGR